MRFLEKSENMRVLKTGVWLTTISYMALIFYLSSLTKVGDYELPYGADKVVHFFEYAVLGFLMGWSLKISGIKKYFLIGWLISFLYGLSDEIHQSFVPMRDASAGDAAADGIGAFAGAYWYLKLQSMIGLK